MRKGVNDYFIVDCHSHLYTTHEIGLRASRDIGFSDYAGCHDGTVEDALASMERDNIAKMIMMNWTPTALMKDAALERLPLGLPDYSEAEKEIDAMLIGRVLRRNLWTCDVAKQHPNLIPFISVDAAMTPQQMKAEILDRVHNHGAKGIKFQHAGNRWMAHDRRLWPTYEVCQELDLPILCHSGIAEGFPYPRKLTEPKYFADVLTHFPKLRLVLAHLGVDYWDQTRFIAKTYPNVCFDCLDTMKPFPGDHVLDDEDFISLVREIGVERVVFGSEFPIMGVYRPAVLQHIIDMKLTEEEKRMILGENAMRIFKLS